jgi:hypothetical protein
MYEFVSENRMAFHPRYWTRGVKNGSRDFNYYRWNAESRKNASQHIGRDTRVQPHAEEPLELEPEVRFVLPPGGVIVFSGAQLHSTVPNTTNMVRWSIDFRTINIDDVVNKRGAPNTDNASTGTSLRDFLRVADFAPPEDVVAAYDDGVPVGGVVIYKPEIDGRISELTAARVRTGARRHKQLVRSGCPIIVACRGQHLASAAERRQMESDGSISRVLLNWPAKAPGGTILPVARASVVLLLRGV